MSRTVTVVQARTSSTRLPQKIFKPLQGEPLLIRMVERVAAARHSGTVVVATTTDAADDAVESLCLARGISCFRGHPTDLLDRHYKAALEHGADCVVKIPSDCPLIDPAVIDRVIGAFLDDGTCDFVSNMHPATYPDGNDVEVMPMAVMQQAWTEARRPFEREHTTPFIWERPERFRLVNVPWESGLDYSMTHRWTIDYDEDYVFIRAVYDEWYPVNPKFSLDDVLALLDRRPDIAGINAHLAGVNWYRHHLDELRTVGAAQTRRAGATHERRSDISA